MGFIKCLWWVVSRVFGYTLLCGGLAGLIADIPALQNDPLALKIQETLGVIFANASYIVRFYPLQVALSTCILALLRWLVVTPHAERMRAEVEKKRKDARSAHGGKKKQRNKSNKRRR